MPLFHWRSLSGRNGRNSAIVTERSLTTPPRSGQQRDREEPNGHVTSPPITPPDSESEPVPHAEFLEIRARIDASLSQLTNLLKAMKAPLPTGTGDGTALTPEKKTGIANAFKAILQDTAKLGIHTVEKVGKMGLLTKLGEEIDDKQYLMEYLVKAASSLPDDQVVKKLTDDFVTTLWGDLQHPPQVFMEDKYQYRQADGSNNSYLHPRLGAAHESYARTVKPSTIQPAVLPDPGVLFDTLMKREEPKLHPNRISSMLFYMASIIIHDLFRTNHEDFRISDTSSYLDLSPLYGSDWKEQKRMRTFKDGKIEPDCFSETRLLSFPEGVGALLILFNRFHNYTVEQLALINEGGRFNPPSDRLTGEKKEKATEKYDNDLFQTGRLITCGLYVNIVLIDYVRTILNLNRTDDNWQLNPRVEIPGVALGVGNQVSAEFNLVYRWHSAVSDKDDKWTRKLFVELFEGKAPEDVPQRELLETLGKLQSKEEAKNPQDRDFHKLERQENGKFRDEDLSRILVEGIEDCANAYGARQVPAVFRAIEVLGIKQARAWNLATLNEFRKHFSLKPYTSFSEISGNDDVAEMLRRLYDHPDNVELYPGLVVEDAKIPKEPGSGLCPPFTTSRAVLSDAVALVRGDRFYTTSYHPKALTNWGFTEQSGDVTVDNGCVLYKLFLRALPNSFAPNSVYVHYPFTIPSEMKKILIDLKKAPKYNFERPGAIPPPQMVFSHAAAIQITEDQDAFKVTWGEAIEFLMGPAAKNFMLSGDEAPNKRSRAVMEKAMYMGSSSRGIPNGNEAWLHEVRSYYEDITKKLLRQKTYKIDKFNQVDMIRDVGNLAHVHFATEMFSIPLKTEEYPQGIFTEHQMYLIMAAVFICVFFDVDPPHTFPLRQQAHEATQQLGNLIQLEVAAIKSTGNFTDFMQKVLHPSSSPLKNYGLHMIHRLINSGMEVKDIVWGNLIGTAGGMVANQGQLFGQVLDYLFTEGVQYIPVLHALAHEDTPEADDKIMHYFLEFSRLYGEAGVSRRVAKATTVKDFDRELHFVPGDRVIVNFRSASRDPAGFPNPNEVDLTRPVDSYIHLGHGPHQCLGLPMARVALTAMLKTVAKLDNLRAADVWPGPKSQVKKVLKRFDAHDAEVPLDWHFHAYLTEDWDSFFPFPTSLKINFDGELP